MIMLIRIMVVAVMVLEDLLGKGEAKTRGWRFRKYNMGDTEEKENESWYR